MDLIELFSLVALGAATVYPLVFLFTKSLTNRLFFICSLVGIYWVVALLLVVMTLPVAILLIKVVPQLAQDGALIYLLPLLRGFNFVQDYWLIAFHISFCLFMPKIIYRRYSLFWASKASNQNLA